MSVRRPVTNNGDESSALLRSGVGRLVSFDLLVSFTELIQDYEDCRGLFFADSRPEDVREPLDPDGFSALGELSCVVDGMGGAELQADDERACVPADRGFCLAARFRQAGQRRVAGGGA